MLKPMHALVPLVKAAAFYKQCLPSSSFLPSFFFLPSQLNLVRDQHWWCNVVSVEAVFYPIGPPLGSLASLFYQPCKKMKKHLFQKNNKNYEQWPSLLPSPSHRPPEPKPKLKPRPIDPVSKSCIVVATEESRPEADGVGRLRALSEVNNGGADTW